MSKPETQETAAKRRQLSHKALIAVSDYIRNNEANLRGCTAKHIRQQISQHTDIALTQHQLAGLQRTLEIDWLIPRRPRKATPADEAVQILAVAIARLYGERGLEAPPEVVELLPFDLITE